MKIAFFVVFIFAWASRPAPIAAAEKPETPHLEFVTEYIRELAAIEAIRDAAKRELEEGGEANSLSSSIHIYTLFRLELQAEIGVLRIMRLNPPYDSLITDVMRFYDSKISVYKRMTDIVSTILAGTISPKPTVDYGGLAAELPQLRARLDDIDHTLFKAATPSVFITLIDPKADSQNHASHMKLTKAERARLIDMLNNGFGSKMDQKDQNYGVSSATVLRDLLKERKCSDEPWE
jgi:hypothetical protein